MVQDIVSCFYIEESNLQKTPVLRSNLHVRTVMKSLRPVRRRQQSAIFGRCWRRRSTARSTFVLRVVIATLLLIAEKFGFIVGSSMKLINQLAVSGLLFIRCQSSRSSFLQLQSFKRFLLACGVTLNQRSQSDRSCLSIKASFEFC